jgi:hypothetical protein
MSEPLDKYGRHLYFSDDGNTYAVKMMNVLATAGGFDVAGSGVPDLPSGYEMRYILGESSTGAKGKLHIASVTTALWVTPASWTGNNATVYSVGYGAVGERRHATL